jgi:hypothetical protein
MTIRSGRATIKLRDGRVFVADHAELSRGGLMFTGRERVKDLHGIRFYNTKTHTLPMRLVRGINWHREAGSQ